MKRVYVFSTLLLAVLFIGILIGFTEFVETEIVNQSTTLILNMSDQLNIDNSYKTKIQTAGNRTIALPHDLIFIVIVLIVLGSSLWDAYNKAPMNPLFFALNTFGGLVLGIFFLSLLSIYIVDWFYTEVLNQVFSFTLSSYPFINHFYELWWIYFIIFYITDIITNQFLGNQGEGVQ